MRMRSGLFDFEDDPTLLGNLEAHFRPYSAEDVVKLASQHPAIFAPGTKYAYCNTNFCILELIIERVTGNALATEFARRIFEPIGLANTSYPVVEDLTLPEPYIRGYERIMEDGVPGWQECSEVFFGRGDGALISTATDLARFFRALLLEEKLLPSDLLQQMMAVVPDDPPAEEMYGLGLMSDLQPCGSLWGHSGGGFGYGNMPYLHLGTGRFGVLMINGSYGYKLAEANLHRPRFSPKIRTGIYCGGET
jgi:D-alanyl-D-alanine carboxypeptidase